MKKIKFIAACLLSLASLSSCSNLLDDTENGLIEDSQESMTQPYSVKFKLAGAGHVGSRSAANSNEESTVNTLYAVVFSDGAAQTTMSTTSVTGTETFVSAIPVTFSASFPELSFTLGNAGDYKICFVANPSASLVEKITGLTEDKTVKDFKALVEDAEPDLENAFLMTSDFYSVTASLTAAANIGTVDLTRTVARIDVVNSAKDVTVKKIVFKNYGAKTQLISDNATFTSDNTIGNAADKEYTPESMTTDQSYTLYTYEQFAGAGDDVATDSRPSLEITYTLSGLTFTHTVEFKNSTEQYVPVKRNFKYTVTLTNNENGQLSFVLDTEDWKDGEDIDASRQDLVAGVINLYPKALTNAAVGDYYMSNGTLREGSQALTETEKAFVIGVVCATGNHIVKTMKTLRGATLTSPHGLVMALKDAATSVTWGLTQDESKLTNLISVQQYYADVDGLANYQAVAHDDSYPAFKAVADYAAKVPAPSTSTGWFLPSVGQWCDILNQSGGLTMSTEVVNCTSNSFTWFYGSGAGGSNSIYVGNGTYYAQNNINTRAHLTSLGDKANPFDVSSTYYYWTSSEYNNTSNACYVYFTSNVAQLSVSGKTNKYKVRAILAF